MRLTYNASTSTNIIISYSGLDLLMNPSPQVEDEYSGHEGSILAICHVPEYECVFTGGEDRGIRSWPVETKVKARNLQKST